MQRHWAPTYYQRRGSHCRVSGGGMDPCCEVHMLVSRLLRGVGGVHGRIGVRLLLGLESLGREVEKSCVKRSRVGLLRLPVEAHVMVLCGRRHAQFAPTVSVRPSRMLDERPRRACTLLDRRYPIANAQKLPDRLGSVFLHALRA